MNTHKFPAIIALFTALQFPFLHLSAQNADKSNEATHVAIKTRGYEHFKNVSFATIFDYRNSLYSLRSHNIYQAKTLVDYIPSPTFSNIALIDGTRLVNIHFDVQGRPVSNRINTGGEASPIKVLYTDDALFLNVIDESGNVKVLNTTNYKVDRQFSIVTPVNHAVISSNLYFLATAHGNEVVVYKYEDGTERIRFRLDAQVTTLVFSAESDQLAVASADGTVSIYDTTTPGFDKTVVLDNLGSATDVVFHREGKYIAVVTDDQHIRIINTKDPEDFKLLEFSKTVDQVRFLYNTNGEEIIFTKQGEADKEEAKFSYTPVFDFLPYYAKRLSQALNARLEVWSRMLPGETLEDYHKRVNAESQAKKTKEFEDEIIAEFANEMVSISQIVIGDYKDGELAIGYANMPLVNLAMSEAEAALFLSSESIEFHNVKFALTSRDNFEIVYAEVENKRNGKIYIFDNLNRSTLDDLIDDSPISSESRRIAAKDNEILIKYSEEVVEKAKQQNLISDHTHITVNTSVEPSTDEDGHNITNYNIDFAYEVDSEFSSKDDFSAGRYRIEQSNAAVAMLTIAKQAFETEFEKYIKAGKKVVISVTGSADALPIRRTIPYDGCYGNFDNIPYTLNTELKSMTVGKRTGITQNEQLAFLRAQGVKHYIEQNLPDFEQMKAQYKTIVELSEGTGSEYRRIHVRFKFIDAFSDTNE